MFCSGCGECCQRQQIIVTEEEIQLIEQRTRAKLDVKPTGRENRFLLEKCPFFIGVCTIHDIRPCQCRLYHCGRLKAGDPMLETMGEIRELMANNPEYARERALMESAGVEWGNKHGWSWRKLECAI